MWVDGGHPLCVRGIDCIPSERQKLHSTGIEHSQDTLRMEERTSWKGFFRSFLCDNNNTMIRLLSPRGVSEAVKLTSSSALSPQMNCRAFQGNDRNNAGKMNRCRWNELHYTCGPAEYGDLSLVLRRSETQCACSQRTFLLFYEISQQCLYEPKLSDKILYYYILFYILFLFIYYYYAISSWFILLKIPWCRFCTDCFLPQYQIIEYKWSSRVLSIGCI